VADERLKIAVFIDFDNIEIGVKTTLNARFDVGGVLEAIKERGEIVSKFAYGDWTRATEYGRSMSQHAIHMIQRNLTPGGDKNGADINLALDALEMAFTHSHINAFVIVGGDSDFITLVEKLKQYDRKVFVVGGRAFTSHVMQRNCTEFVAYEDITGVPTRGGRQTERGGRQSGETNLSAAMPLIRRALKLLADREVVPQLGLLKSTLLQLDSTFSERAYGVSSFRDFVQKLAKAGFVSLKGTDRSFHVELRDTGDGAGAGSQAPAAAEKPAAPVSPPPSHIAAAAASAQPATETEAATETAKVEPEASASERTDRTDATEGAEAPPRLGPVEGFRILQAAFTRPGVNPRWPMYVRQVKQFVRQYDETFDERKYGFTGIVDALRYGQREGLFRLDRDRQGVVRVYAGLRYPRTGAPEAQTDAALGDVAQPIEPPPMDGGDLFAAERSNVETEAPESGVDTIGADESRATDVESVTYDVVTHVDADSGVIDVARHEDRGQPADGEPATSEETAPTGTPGGRTRQPKKRPARGGAQKKTRGAVQTPHAAGARKRTSPSRGRGKKPATGEPSGE
jgi:uncharacterized LabA/DUF88 family protein